MLLALPEPEADLLRALRSDLPALRARVCTLRDAGWPLRSIGEPLSSPRSTVRAWELQGREAHVTDTRGPATPPPSVRPHPRSSAAARTRALRPDVPEADRARIAELAPLARRVRGGTPHNSALREAKRQLDALVIHHYNRGVSIQRLAELANVTYRAMSVRLQAATADATTAAA